MLFHNADDDLRDNEWPDEADLDDDATTTCPACGASIYHDSAACPVCHTWLDDAPPASLWRTRPWWWIILALAGVIAVIAVLTLR